MIPEIGMAIFGLINIDGTTYKDDVLIRLNGQVETREKELSKDIFGTSHIISLVEAEHVFEDGAEQLLIGSGYFGRCKLSPEAAAFYFEKGCEVILLHTSKAVRRWNQYEGAMIGLFHITC